MMWWPTLAACMLAQVSITSAQASAPSATNSSVNPPTIFGEESFGSASTTGRYTANIDYGGQTFTVQLDTGSADFLVASVSCQNCNPSQTAYAETGINTGCEAETKYGSAVATYNVYLDTAQIAGAASNGQNVAAGALIQESGTLQSNLQDGILGLGYKEISAIYTYCKKLPVIDQLAADGAIYEGFGLCFKNDQSGGLFVLGCAAVDGLQYTPVIQEGYYQVEINSMQYGGTSILSKKTVALLDSGTTLLVLPSAAFNNIVGDICATAGDPSGCDADFLANNAVALNEGDFAKFPDITIQFNGGASLVVPPTNYWVEVESKRGQDYYMLGIQAGSQLIVGDVAMQGNYLFFDKAAGRVGMMPAPNCNPSNGQPITSGQCAGASFSTASGVVPPTHVMTVVLASLLAAALWL